MRGVAVDDAGQPVEGLARRVHRAAQDPQAVDRCRGAERARDRQRSIRVDGETARGAAGVDSVARIEQARAEEARVGIDHPGDDRRAGGRPSSPAGPLLKAAQPMPGGDDRRQPLDADPRPGNVVGIRPELAGEAGLGGDAGHPAGDRLPGIEVPARRAERRRGVPLEVQCRRQDPELPAEPAGERRQLVDLGRRPGVEPGHRRTGGDPGRVGWHEGRALADAADREDRGPLDGGQLWIVVGRSPPTSCRDPARPRPRWPLIVG